MMKYKNVNRKLSIACRQGNLTEVKQLLAAKASLFFNEQGQHSLHLATLYGRLQVVEYMITDCSIPIDLPQQSPEGMSPLLIAVRSGHLELFNSLLEHKADADYTSKNKEWNILTAAVASPNQKLLDAIMLHEDLPAIEFLQGASERVQTAVLRRARDFIALSENTAMIAASLDWMGRPIQELNRRVEEQKMGNIAKNIGLPPSYIQLMETACLRNPEPYDQYAPIFMQSGDQDTEEECIVSRSECIRVLTLPVLKDSIQYPLGVLLILGWKFLQLSHFRLKSSFLALPDLGAMLIDYYKGEYLDRLNAFTKLIMQLDLPVRKPQHNRGILDRLSIKQSRLEFQLRDFLWINQENRIKLFVKTAQTIFPGLKQREFKDNTFKKAIVAFNLATEHHKKQVTKKTQQVMGVLASVKVFSIPSKA